MLSKKIFFSAAFVSMAGLVACGDDSSSNSGSGELPKSVPTFFDLADVECNADRKCETIIVEEGPDTYECDGVSQWNMLINSMPSKVCPAKEEEKGTEGDEEGKTEGDDNKTPESSASETTSTDSGAESTDSNTESTDSGEGSEGGEEGGEGSEGGEELTGPTGELYSCLQDSEIEMFGESMKTKICTETTANSTTATELKATCTSVDVEGMKITSTEGTGCSAETGYVKKCVVSNDAAVYYFDADAAGKSCEELLKDKN